MSRFSRPPFPLVLSAARIDGEFKIQVRMAGGEIINAGVGHSLPGDWLITQLSLDSITASQAGEAFTIDLTHPEAPVLIRAGYLLRQAVAGLVGVFFLASLQNMQRE